MQLVKDDNKTGGLRMAYRYGDRKQKILFPQTVDEYIPEDAPVRAYDVFVNSLDLEQLGMEINAGKVGCPQYDPRSMLKLLIYGYSYGIRSSRKLERETHYNLSFIWLAGGLKPDHKTIAEFRRQNKSALKRILRQCARLCIKLDLIEGNTLFVDGTQMRANASIKHSWTKERCRRHLKRIDQRIKEILSECESIDEQEKDQPSLVKMKEELRNQDTLKSRVREILGELQAEEKKSINTTDSDCTRTHGRGGSHAGYNVQSVVDEKHGLIVSGDVVKENTDAHQFARQIEQANETLEKKCKTACADAGYDYVDELEKIAQQDIKVIVPSRKQAAKVKKVDPFDKSNFKYDRENDGYVCPAGQILTYRRDEPEKRRRVYRVKRSVCQPCRNFGLCTTGKIGRKVTRLLKEDLRQKLEQQYEQPDSQEIYKLRKQKVELPFGHIKHNLKVGGFLLRGLDGVKAEASILASCFNIARMISMVGVRRLVANLAN
jgi:transposase